MDARANSGEDDDARNQPRQKRDRYASVNAARQQALDDMADERLARDAHRRECRDARRRMAANAAVGISVLMVTVQAAPVWVPWLTAAFRWLIGLLHAIERS